MIDVGTGPCPTTPAEYAELINTEWRKSVEGIMGAGRWLVEAKSELAHGEFGELCEMLPFDRTSAFRLMAVAACDHLNVAHGQHLLPPSWRTLYELSQLNETEWATIEPHLSPELERGQIRSLLAGTPHVAQNAGNNEWYTPPEYLAAARQFMGGIDLDPASSDIANLAVRARTYFTIDDDGLDKAWAGRVWMNPPYAGDLIGRFVEKLCEHVDAGDVTAAVVLVNNATETGWFRELSARATALCFTSGRVRFLDPDGNPGAPLQGQAVLGIGGKITGFISAFGSFGWCAIPGGRPG